MKKLMILLAGLLAGQLFGQNVLQGYFHSYGQPDDAAAETAYIQQHLSVLNFNTLAQAPGYWIPVSYRYDSYSDSAVIVKTAYFVDDSMVVINRVIEPLLFNDAEPVTLTWVRVSKNSPAATQYSQFSSWRGGPQDLRIPEIPVALKAVAAVEYLKKKQAVDAAVEKAKGENWKAKRSSKNMSEKEKRAACWAIQKGRIKESDVTKTKKAGGSK